MLRLVGAQSKALASIRRDGTVFVRSGATDIGCGTYTVMTMLAADCLGVPIERVQFGLGDSAMPSYGDIHPPPSAL